MMELEEILFYHQQSIEKYGGSKGIRDEGALQSAIERPYATFGGIDLYPTAFHKSAAILESIIKNHPFVDGNKRTALLSAAALLLSHHYELIANENDIYNKIIEIASSHLEFDNIVEWIKEHSTEI